ncbi:MAG: hypothetical protein ACJ8MR_07910 [Povalibacter sp.]
MIKRFILSTSLIGAFGMVHVARASSLDQGQWITTVTGGMSFTSNDTLQPSALGQVDAGRFDPAWAGVPAIASLDHIDFSDAFDNGKSLGFEAGYMSMKDLEPFVRLQRTQLNGNDLRIGSVELPDRVAPVSASFDDLKSWNLDLGVRYFFADTGRVRAFVDGYAGAVRNDSLNARVSVEGTPEPTVEERYLAQRTKFDTGLDGGVSLQVSDAADLSLSVGAQYVAGRQMDSTAVDSLGVNGGSVNDEHWSMPVNLGVSFHF